jgi:Uma2 family endonuclease
VLLIADAHRDRIRDDGIHGPPDLAVEILSQSSVEIWAPGWMP